MPDSSVDSAGGILARLRAVRHVVAAGGHCTPEIADFVPAIDVEGAKIKIAICELDHIVLDFPERRCNSPRNERQQRDRHLTLGTDTLPEQLTAQEVFVIETR